MMLDSIICLDLRLREVDPFTQGTKELKENIGPPRGTDIPPFTGNWENRRLKSAGQFAWDKVDHPNRVHYGVCL